MLVRLMRFPLISTLTLTAAILGVLSIAGCSDDDCPSCPGGKNSDQYEGRIYVGMVYSPDGSATIEVFDTVTDSLLDTLALDPNRSYHTVEITPDGKYLLVANDLVQALILDAMTLLQVGFIDDLGATILVRDGSAALSAHGFGDLDVYSIPDGELLASGQVIEGYTWGRHRYDSKADLAYGIAQPNELYGSSDTTDIVCYDLDSLAVIKRFRVVDETGVVYHINNVVMNFEAGIGHAIGFDVGHYYLNFDIATGMLRTRSPIFASYGDIELSPDGSEVFVSDPGNPFAVDPTYNPGIIYIFDAVTGMPSGELPTDPDDEHTGDGPIDVWQLEFSPDGSILYAASGNWDFTGTVVKYEPKRREIIGALLPDFNRNPRELAIGPKWEQE